jgi:PAS domain-containing protein
MGGQLEEVADPVGAKPVADLAETFNYLLARLRASGPMERRSKVPGSTTGVRQAVRPPAAVGPAAASPAAVVAPPVGAVAEGRIVCSPSYQVTEASPECEALLGVPPRALVGRHLLETSVDKALVDGVLKALGVIGSAGEERVEIVTARGDRIHVTVTRTGKDQPVTILLGHA